MVQLAVILSAARPLNTPQDDTGGCSLRFVYPRVDVGETALGDGLLQMHRYTGLTHCFLLHTSPHILVLNMRLEYYNWSEGHVRFWMLISVH